MVILLEDLDQILETSNVGNEVVVCYRSSLARRILYQV